MNLKKNVLVVGFMCLGFIKGMEVTAVAIVLMGYTVLLRDILLNWDRFTSLVKKLPGPEWLKERYPTMIAGELVEFGALGAGFILF